MEMSRGGWRRGARGAIITGLSSLYNDDNWMLYDTGKIARGQ